MVKDEATAKATTATEERIGDVLRLLRTEHHLSVRTLAARAEVSPSFLSQIENGLVSPSIASLERIAMALGVTLGDFFRQTAAAPTTVVRREGRSALTSEWSRAQVEALGPTGPGHTLEPMMLTLGPGGRSGAHPYAHGGDEFALVFEGEVILSQGETIHQLARGDAVTLPAGVPHQWENVGPTPAQIVLVTNRIT